MIEIVKVENKAHLKTFINLPWQIYKDDPNWVPPLKMAVKDLLSTKHPFRKTAQMDLFLAYKEKVAVGRIAVIVNHAHNKFHNENVGHFGLYEATNDYNVCEALLNTAKELLKHHLANSIIGPVNPSTNYECGLLVEGLDDPAQIMMTYNPNYYQTHFEKWGLAKAKDLLAYKIDIDFKMPEKIKFISERLEKKAKVTYRPVSKKHWDRDIAALFDIYNDAWEKNWGFIPMTKEEFIHSAKDLKSIVDVNLVLFVEVAGEVAGLIVTLPDFNQVLKDVKDGQLFPTGLFKILFNKKKIKRVRVITLGLKQKFRKSGLETILYTKSQTMIQNTKMKEVEMSWILEDNINMNRPLILMGAKPYKRYRIFEKSLV